MQCCYALYGGAAWEQKNVYLQVRSRYTSGLREGPWAYFDTNSMELVDANANLQRLHWARRDRNGRELLL